MQSDLHPSVEYELNSQLTKRIEDWKSRLIDLSRRNNLLYFKRSKRGNLGVTNPNAFYVFNRLVLGQKKFDFWLPPEGDKSVSGQKVSDQPSFNHLVCDGVSRYDVDKILKNLYRRSLSDFRERGVRILHAAFGMLVWKDLATNEEIHSPLIMVPVELFRETIRNPFSISVPQVEEETVLNPALQVKLKSDYKIDLPPLPEEWTEDSLKEYFDSVSKVVAQFGWTVDPTLHIGLFSFHKLVIYKDLEANSEIITQHPIIRAICGVKDSKLVLDNLPEEKDVDRIEDPESTYRVLDADSSQRVCIDYSLQGQSFVMQGPPGTGKSQTIANIVGECIARGKSVLFVSDKMAALEVVYKRLSDVGLAHFCLELHSSKANKQEVVAELKRSLDEQLIPGKIPSAHDFEKMKQLRERLNEYVTALHIKQPLLQKSAYEILGELITLQHIPFVQVELENPGGLTPQRMQELEELMVNLTNVWQVVEEQDFPWRGYRGTRYNLDIRSELIAQIEQIDATVNLLRLESSNYSQQLGLNPPSTLSRIKWLLGLNVFLSESPKPEAEWVLNPQIDSLLTEAKDHQETINWCTSTRNRLLERYNSQFFTLMLNTSEELERFLKDIQSYVYSSSVFDGELLRKREKLRSLIRNLSDMVAKWREKSVALGGIFGLPSDNLTFNRVKQFSRIAEFCFSPEKPELNWFDNQIFQKAKETFRRAKRDYEEFNSLRADLSQKYTERVYDLDLDEFTRKYSGPYNSFLKYFRPSYYRDQKQISLVSKQGRVPKTVRKDLLDARRVKALRAEIESYKDAVQQSLGHFYNGYETDFSAVEKAIQITEEAYHAAGTLEIPESLTKIISYPSNPPQEIKKLGTELAESVEKWESEIDELQNILPSKLPSSNLPMNQSSLENVEDWAIQTGRVFSPLYELTKEISETIKQEAPESYSVIIGDLQAAESVRKKEAEILNQKEALREKFGKRFLELETDWEDIIQVLAWTKKVQEYFGSIRIPEQFAEIISEGSESAPSIDELERLSQETPKVLSDLEVKFGDGEFYRGQQLAELDLEVLHDRVKQLRDRIDDLQTFIDFKELKGQFSLIHLGGFFDCLVEQHPPRAELVDVFRRGAYQEWINNLYDDDPRLGKFRRENHEQLIEDFRALDQELIRLSSNMVIEAANSRKPQDILIQATDSEVNTLLKEAAKKRRLMPIRTLLQRIPHVLPKIKPCLLMSPISVSQFLDSEMMKFDLVLFDEASQIVPEDAIGAIYRGKSVVVAGDNRQLPPTSFFQKSLLDDFDWDEMTENEVEVFDSILDECLGIGLPVKTLRWHYRSRHEDLIAFSNSHFYEGNLVTFPSAEANHHALGVKLFYAEDGLYDRGGRRDNLKEAEIITDLVFEHFQNQPESTLGVVTFSIAQMEAIEEMIESRLARQPEYEQFFREDRLEGFFVKNLENVQGDERDVMIFSVGYARDPQGVMTMNFGPLNKPGGERRLNVAITRAREKTILVTSIKSSDIDLEATKAAGVIALRHYLEYAEKGPEILSRERTSGRNYETPIEADVAQELRKLDYNVELQVGCSDYRIDLGVIDPANSGSYLLGVECDGPTYKSSNSARDRDRLREQVLKNLGWRIHRVWSPSWVARKESEIRKLKEALQQACELQKRPEPPPSKILDKKHEQEPKKLEVRKIQFGGLEQIGVPYKMHPLTANFKPYIKVHISRHPYTQMQKNEFHFPENRSIQSRLLEELVKAEGPIHFDYAVQRLGSAWDVKRISQKITSAVSEAMGLLIQKNKIIQKGMFLWPPELIEVQVRVPVANIPESRRPPEQIPPEEIENAMKLITQYSLGISPDSLISETAKLFGFTHSGEKIKQVFTDIYKKMVREQKLVLTNNTVTTS